MYDRSIFFKVLFCKDPLFINDIIIDKQSLNNEILWYLT